jgi:DNA-binding NarL/FixJ family response regulator
VRILLTGSTPPIVPPIQNILRDAALEAEVVLDPLSPDVLEKIARGVFDGVVCRADGPEAITLVSELRRQNTDVPIVVLSERPDPGFQSQALSSGASSVIPAEASAAVIAENVRQVMNLKGALQRFKERSRSLEQLRAELTEAVLERKSISQYGRHIHRQWRKRGLLPLLVQDEPAAAFQMVKALEKAEVFAPLPIMKSAEEARGYLEGSPPYANREIYPLPNAILIEMTPMTLGVGLLKWIRSQGSITSIPVIVLSPTGHPEEIREAYGNFANSFLIRPSEFDDLVTMVRSIDLYWTRINIGGTA